MNIDISNIEGVSNMELGEFVVNIMNWLIRFSAVLSVVMIIVAGFQFIFSLGDDKKIAKATSGLIFAIIGMVVVFLAPTIIQYVIDNFLR